jgi:hypothetical protein
MGVQPHGDEGVVEGAPLVWKSASKIFIDAQMGTDETASKTFGSIYAARSKHDAIELFHGVTLVFQNAVLNLKVQAQIAQVP